MCIYHSFFFLTGPRTIMGGKLAQVVNGFWFFLKKVLLISNFLYSVFNLFFLPFKNLKDINVYKHQIRKKKKS